MRAEVTGDEVALPVSREVWGVNRFEAGELRVVARAHAVEQAGRARVGEVHRAGDAPTGALVARAVRHERLAIFIEDVAPRIAEAAEVNLELVRARSKRPDAAAVEAAHAGRSLDMAVDVNRLVHVDLPIHTPLERMQQMMRILRAERRKRGDALVSKAVVVGILEMQELGAVRHIHAAIAAHQSRRNLQAIGEDARHVSRAVAIGIGDDDDQVIHLLAGLQLGIGGRDGNVEFAGVVPGHLNGFRQEGIAGVQIYLEPFGDLEGRRRFRVVFLAHRAGGVGEFGAPVRGGGLEQPIARDFGAELKGVGHRLLEPVDLVLELGDRGIKERHLGGVLPLLMLAKPEQVGVILRTPAVEIEGVLPDDQFAQLFRLVVRRSAGDVKTGGPTRFIAVLYHLAIDQQRIAARIQPGNLEAYALRPHGAELARFEVRVSDDGGRESIIQGGETRSFDPAIDVAQLHAVAAVAEGAVLIDAKPRGVGSPAEVGGDF